MNFSPRGSLTSFAFALDDGFDSESSSQDVVESFLSGKFRTLMGDVSCFGEVKEEADDGTSLFEIGMKVRDDDPIDVVGDDALVVLIFNGGGLQSASHELLPLFFLLF